MQRLKSASDNSFEKKWSVDIASAGYSSIPNCLIFCQQNLGIKSSEFSTLSYLLASKFKLNNPTPSARTIATGSDHSVNTVRKHLRDLEARGIIKRVYRTGTSSEYSFSPLIHRLENHHCINPIKKRAGVSSKLVTPPSPRFDTKEEVLRKRFNNNSGLSHIGEIIKQRPRAP